MTAPQPCDEWAEVLSAYADDEATPEESERLRDHFKSCEVCRAWFESIGADRQAYAGAFAERPRGDVWVSQVVERLPADQRSKAPTGRRWLRLTEALGLAAICVLLIAILYPSLTTVRRKARATQALSNMKQIAPALVMYADAGQAGAAPCPRNLHQITMALRIYADDHDDRLPPASSWQDAIFPDYIDSADMLKCPYDDGDHECSYAMSRSLSAARLEDIPDPSLTPLLWDADQTGRWAPRHDGGGYASFVDGHAELYQEPPPGVSTGGSLGKVGRNYGIADRLHMAYDAGVTVETPDVLEAVHSAERIVREQQGFVLESTFTEAEAARYHANLTFKIPTEQLEVTLMALSELGRMTARTVHGEDRTQDVVSVETSLRREGEKQQRLGEQVRKTRPATRAPLQEQVAASEEKTLKDRQERYGVRSETVLATVAATFESPADTQPGSGAIIMAAFSSAGGWSARVGGVTLAWAVGLAPVWVPVLGGIIVVRRWARKRRRGV